MSQRKVTEWSEKQFIVNRYMIWFGSDMPKTISAKEIIDNALDQAADNLAKNINIHITNNSIAVMDSGNGISTDKSDTGQTHLFLAVNKLYTSSNYDGTDGLAGTNGVGATATNALSKSFKAGHIKDGVFTGYLFTEGEHASGGAELDILHTDPDFKTGSIDKGFYVEANYDDEILGDAIDIEWLLKYTRARTGELPEGVVVDVQYEDIEGFKNQVRYNKIEGSDFYVNSWEEAVNEVPSARIVTYRNGWKFAFCGDKDSFGSISSIVQGAPVSNPNVFSMSFDIEDVAISVRVPVVFYYRGKENPAYTDQTKRRVRMKHSQYNNALRAQKELYKIYLAKAENDYLTRVIGDNKTSMYHPALGDSDYKELIVSEGYSAMSGIVSKRKYKTQACFALRGKMLNVMQKDMKAAMKSDVVKDFLNIIMTTKFDKIILATDADPDGAHISTLLLGILARYGRDYLIDGKVYYCKTPLYVFEKGKDVRWSDNINDRPEGYSLSVKKGLGSLTSAQIKMFITDPETRDLYRFSYDGIEDLKSLEFALIDGGKDWIHE